MCGVIGILIRDPALEPALGSMLVPMIDALADRGPDSSGVAVYADGDPFGVGLERGPGSLPDLSGDSVTRVSLGGDRDLDWAQVGADLESQLGAAVTVRVFETGAVVRSSAVG